jgi:hypothetical protein
MPCLSGAPDQVSDDEVPIPRLHVTATPRPSAYAAAISPADSDDDAPIPLLSLYCSDFMLCSSPAPQCFSPLLLHLHSYWSPQPVPQAGGRGPLGYGWIDVLLLPPVIGRPKFRVIKAFYV